MSMTKVKLGGLGAKQRAPEKESSQTHHFDRTVFMPVCMLPHSMMCTGQRLINFNLACILSSFLVIILYFQMRRGKKHFTLVEHFQMTAFNFGDRISHLTLKFFFLKTAIRHSKHKYLGHPFLTVLLRYN